MKLFVIVVLALLGFAAASEPFDEETNQYLFVQWAKEHNKVYAHDEFFHRFGVFKSNLEIIRAHNDEYEAGKHSFFLGMNEHGDLTGEEFKNKLFGYTPRSRSYIRSLNEERLSNTTLPDSVDWVSKGAVTPVKNQQQCGSCWAFSTTGSTEGAHFLKTGKLVSLSEQQLVDCSGAEGNMGCQGGLMDNGFEYIIKNNGLCSESEYPYTASQGTCQTSCQVQATISSYKDVPHNDENALKAAAAQQPVSVAIEADKSSFQFYSGGVYDSSDCGTQLDHGVLVVGYGVDSGKKFWKVKNSWGATWGEQGYIRLARDTSSTGLCGIAMEPSYPVV